MGEGEEQNQGRKKDVGGKAGLFVGSTSFARLGVGIKKGTLVSAPVIFFVGKTGFEPATT